MTVRKRDFVLGRLASSTYKCRAYSAYRELRQAGFDLLRRDGEPLSVTDVLDVAALLATHVKKGKST